MAYAENTTVAVEKTRAELEVLLKKKGCAKFAIMYDTTLATVAFECSKRMVRFELPLPSITDKSVSHRKKDGWWQVRSNSEQMIALAQEERRRWRVLLLAIKAKFEVIETGLSTFDIEFMPQIVIPTPDGALPLGRWALPQIEAAYATGKPLPMLGTG